MKIIFLKNPVVGTVLPFGAGSTTRAQEYAPPSKPVVTGRSPGVNVTLLSSDGAKKTYVLVLSGVPNGVGIDRIGPDADDQQRRGQQPPKTRPETVAEVGDSASVSLFRPEIIVRKPPKRTVEIEIQTLPLRSLGSYTPVGASYCR